MSPQALPRAEYRGPQSACADLDGTLVRCVSRLPHSRMTVSAAGPKVRQ